jgi:hypothetical protein
MKQEKETGLNLFYTNTKPKLFFDNYLIHHKPNSMVIFRVIRT